VDSCLSAPFQLVTTRSLRGIILEYFYAVIAPLTVWNLRLVYLQLIVHLEVPPLVSHQTAITLPHSKSDKDCFHVASCWYCSCCLAKLTVLDKYANKVQVSIHLGGHVKYTTCYLQTTCD